MFKYFLFFLAMLVGAGIGIYIGLLVAQRRGNPTPISSNDKKEDMAVAAKSEESSEKGVKKEDAEKENTSPATQQTNLLASKIGEYVSEEADPDEAEEILDKMRKQDQRYCALRQGP